jgi:methylenetetrahydromethanopterin dehydrogenase
MDVDSCSTLIETVSTYDAQLVLVISPNASLDGPKSVRTNFMEKKVPVISISDAPSKKAWQYKDEKGKKKMKAEEGEGYIIIPSDSMIGARAEFLDPTEMVLFNSDVLKVLASGGVIRGLQIIIGKVMEQVKAGKEVELPAIILDADAAMEYANYTNPYAGAKAYAALKIAEGVADVTTKGCFKLQDPVQYVPMVAAGHEMMRTAGILADEARELEKGQDTLYRSPHGSDGRVKAKTKFADKPK